MDISLDKFIYHHTTTSVGFTEWVKFQMCNFPLAKLPTLVSRNCPPAASISLQLKNENQTKTRGNNNVRKNSMWFL
jgi:hypothetical protein